MIRFSPNPNRAREICWHEWGKEAFQKSQREDKPVILFLSAFWCRYCQRMDEGAFSDGDNIALLNAYFIAMRTENAQRPDIDARYNLNGWPTIAFMSPYGELLGATNYLASEEFGNLLARVYTTYQEKKDQLRSAEETVPESFEKATPPLTGTPTYEACLLEITKVIMELADRVHGGYGRGQKFIQAEANDFLLSRHDATRDSECLDHVCLTLDRMSASPIHDQKEGGYFRTSSGADWSEPHREKLLAEQAGLLGNSLRAFRITGRSEYARMAEEIIEYLDHKLSDPGNGAFYGCEDFLQSAEPSLKEEFFTIIDRCIYTDANAQAIVNYLAASEILGNSGCKERALKALEFLWDHCRSREEGMFHYFDGAPHVPGLLNDQAQTGAALVKAHRATRERKYLDRAKELAEFIITEFKNPNGGYYDLCAPSRAHLKFQLTLIEQNGAAASFFLMLAESTKDLKYRQAALPALGAFRNNFRSYGIHAASFGQALGKHLHGY
jgi:uncharacterized protein